MKEKNIQNSALLAVGARRDTFIFRNQTGVFRAMDDPSRIIKVGNPGAPDTIGVVELVITADMVGKVIGVAVAAEMKTVKGRQSEQQRNWQAAFEARGGKYRLIRSEAEMLAFVEDVKSGRC